jgi:hypothetical protein
LAPALSVFAHATTVGAVNAIFLRGDATLARLFAIAFDACCPARSTGSMYSLTRSSRLVGVDVTLAKMAVQYVSSSKRDTTDVTRVVWSIAVIVSVAGKSGPSLVGLAANGALVHCEASDSPTH